MLETLGESNKQTFFKYLILTTVTGIMMQPARVLAPAPTIRDWVGVGLPPNTVVFTVCMHAKYTPTPDIK